MRTRFNLLSVGLLMALALLAAVVFTDHIVDRGRRVPPSIIVLVLDTVRADHLSAVGYDRPTSPHLDRLAAEGCLFTRAFVPSPWTLPTHASLFTGLMPSEHGCHWEHRFLVESHETLAERLRARGYETGGFSANINVSHFFNLDQGFDTFVEIWRERPGRPGLTDTAITNSEVFKWLDGIPRDKPFFLFVNYMDAHLPYSPPAPERELFYGPDRGEALLASRADLLDLVLSGRALLTPEARAELRDLYDGEIAYLDRMVGELVAGLEGRGLLDKSLLVMTSDHGENLGEGGLVDHQLSVADRLLRVPILMRWPTVIEPGLVIEEMVDFVGLHDVVLDAADGGRQPLSGFLQVPESARILIAEYFRPLEIEERLGPRPDQPHLYSRRAVLRVKEHGRELKLICSAAGGQELYAVSEDPEELMRLEEPWTVDRLSSLLDRERGRWQQFQEPETSSSVGEPLAAEAARILESLGYVASGRLPRGVGVHAAEHLHLGYLRLEEGDSSGAVRDLQLACALAPESAEARFALARALESVDRQAAVELYEEYQRMAAGESGEAGRLEMARERLETLRDR
ncbi:MAG: sulfatase-like hydrolase/transferase [Planctomycetota bacterium]